MALQHLRANIDGMHCDECAQSIRSVAELIEGVHMVNVSFATAEIAGQYDDEHIDQERILREIESIGYHVRQT